MASLLLKNVLVTTTNAIHFLNCIPASRSFSSWMLRHSQFFSQLKSLTPTKPYGVDQKPFLTSCPLPSLQCVAGMKSKLIPKKRCKDCFFVRRRGRLYIYCKTHPRHKQRQFFV